MIENFEPTPEEVARARNPELFRQVDHTLTTEGLILAGLTEAVRKGWINEDQKAEWLDAYITTRNDTLGQTPASNTSP